MTRRITALGLLFASFGWAAASRTAAPGEQPPAAGMGSVPAPSPRYQSRHAELARGDTAIGIFKTLGAPPAAIDAARGVLDKLPIGATVRADYHQGEAVPFRVTVARDAATELVLDATADRWIAHEEPVAWQIERKVSSFQVRPSLWEGAQAAGLSPMEIVSLAKVFEFDVDFNTELRPDAELRVIGEKLRAPDGTARTGEIEGARLVNDGKTWVALRFRAADGTVGWFAPDGVGRRKPFLRSPLEYSNVTSSFSRSRYHPILKIDRPHWGVDFGAPVGTPVRAVADGVVRTAGKSGGHGNFVELEHQAPYTTSYSHLSAILVKAGQQVHQGDVIGKVGQTGLATGPHLHYQFMVNGVYEDPMTADLPLTGSLTDADIAAFNVLRDELMPLLEPAQPSP